MISHSSPRASGSAGQTLVGDDYLGVEFPGRAGRDVLGYPFTERGTQALLELDEVVVREGGVEAQINAYWEGVPIDFFDTQFLTSRPWYEHGRHYEFRLTRFAYWAHPAVEMEMPLL